MRLVAKAIAPCDESWMSKAIVPTSPLATVEYVGWFNHQRLHESLGDIPPIEFEQRYRHLRSA